MADFKLDPATKDIDLTNKTMTLIGTEEESTRQRLEITLGVYKGEWLYNINFGTPWLANDNNPVQLLGKVNQQFVDVTLKDIIVNTAGVISLNSFQSSFDRRSREYTLDFSVVTESGEIVSVSNFSTTL